MSESETGRLPRPGYCAICGREADGQFRRLGEVFCSEGHADEFEREVRALAGAGDTGERRKLGS